ncbi:MAG: trimethylamine methyltransferase family protein [Granulosicoccaceae bacterium]
MSEPSPRRRKPRRKNPAIEQTPRQSLQNNMPKTNVLDAASLDAIHDASLRVLETIGVAVLDQKAAELYQAAGAKQSDDGQRWLLPRKLIENALASAPNEFTLHARNPAHNLTLGANHLNFCSVASAPNASDLDNGRRSGNQTDFRNFLRLSQFFNVIHLTGGYPVEPVDIHPSVRHLECLRDLATLTDKVFHCYSLGKQRNLDAIEIVRLARGISHEQLQQEPSLYTIINVNSPLTLDGPMLEGLMVMAEHNQVVVVTPFTLAGAMAPVSIAGALAQQNAEALAGIALTQLVRPGAPVVYGGFTSNVDMRSGAPAFGTPEYMKAAQISGQLARKYGLPFRSSNVNAANTVDAQAAYESVFALWGAVGGGCNMLMHGAGWLEGGLCASFEKFVLDCDLLQMVQSYLEPLKVDEAELALEAIADVGPGGHFFGTQHTQDRFETAFYSPIISDWRNHESWAESGAPDAMSKANLVWKKALAAYSEPAMPDENRAALDAFVNARIAEGGVKTDF